MFQRGSFRLRRSIASKLLVAGDVHDAISPPTFERGEYGSDNSTLAGHRAARARVYPSRRDS